MTDVWGDERPTRRRVALDVTTGLAFATVMGAVHGTLGGAAAVAAVLLGLALDVCAGAPLPPVASRLFRM